MDVLLIPGFWLDSSSWDAVAPDVESAGHRIHAVTREGEDPRAQLANVLDIADKLTAPYAVVCHSGAHQVAYQLADARAAKLARVIYVDTFPRPARGYRLPEFPVSDEGVPVPDWSAFGQAELRDLNQGLRERIRSQARPEPVGVVTGGYELHDERRREIPATIITSSHPRSYYGRLLARGNPRVAELGAVRTVDWIEVPTGHWPQFTRPHELASAIVTALSRQGTV